MERKQNMLSKTAEGNRSITFSREVVEPFEIRIREKHLIKVSQIYQSISLNTKENTMFSSV